MSATRPIDELKAKATALISERVSRTSIAKVASDLGITRQAVHGFLRRDYCPSLAVIQRACSEWGVDFNVRGLTINQHTLRVERKPTHSPQQMDLYESLKSKRIEVKTRRAGNAMELVLWFKLSA
jgi:predicted transcriptional regulator